MHILDNDPYPLDPQPGTATAVRQALRRVDVPTFGGNASICWDPVWPDTRVREEWTQMTGAHFRALDARYRADGGGTRYDWTPGDGVTYRAEIIALDGVSHKGDTYVNVRMTLKIHGPA